MEETGEIPDTVDRAVEDALAAFLPILTAGMRREEAEQARKALLPLLTLRAAGREPGEFARDLQERTRRAKGLPLEDRRRMLQEEILSLEVEVLSMQVLGTALRVFRKEMEVTREMKKGVRRAIARLGQVNAILVGRFPHRTDLLEQVSDAYLDAMFILGGGEGPTSTRLTKFTKEGESPKKGD